MLRIKEIANFFCKYFANIGHNLASKIPVSEQQQQQHNNNNNNNQFIKPFGSV